MISVKQFLKSLTHAFRGVRLVFKHEQNFRILVVLAGVAILFSILFRITTNQFIVVLLLIGAILTLEMINSIFERIVDTFKPRIHPAVRDIKDIMAGAVLATSLIALIIGFTIFWPHVISLF